MLYCKELTTINEKWKLDGYLFLLRGNIFVVVCIFVFPNFKCMVNGNMGGRLVQTNELDGNIVMYM